MRDEGACMAKRRAVGTAGGGGACLAELEDVGVEDDALGVKHKLLRDLVRLVLLILFIIVILLLLFILLLHSHRMHLTDVPLAARARTQQIAPAH